MAMHDPLTGVLNARAYYQTCDGLLLQLQRSGQDYAVLFVDLDHFKRVNDTHGHAAGDQVLKAAASCIGRNLRSSDWLGRVGGEEFSVFLPDTSLEAALQVAEKIRRSLELMEIPLEHGTLLRVTASLGVAARHPTLRNLAQLQAQADCAMYEAKKSGRNRVTAFAANPPSAAAP
jgi:diguanylate cyclase (GGDEF)-like protein